MSENKYCGDCKHFTNEDVNGYGCCSSLLAPTTCYSEICREHEMPNYGWTEITPDNVEELYNIPEDLLIVAFKLGDIIYYKRNKDMRQTLNDIAKAGGYYYYVLPELKIDNEQDSN